MIVMTDFAVLVAVLVGLLTVLMFAAGVLVGTRVERRRANEGDWE